MRDAGQVEECVWRFGVSPRTARLYPAVPALTYGGPNERITTLSQEGIS